MFQEKVSVIIPAYNRSRYIRQTVESVLNQTYTDIELIVVDDGSTDDTRDILEGYGDRITLLEHEGRQNRGQSASINLGLDRAGGEFFAVELKQVITGIRTLSRGGILDGEPVEDV